jgi:hypothetical protein
MLSLEAFKEFAYEKMQDVYVTFCSRCMVFGESLFQNNDVIFNSREDVRRINEVHNLLRDVDIRVSEVFEITTRVERILQESNNLKLKDFATYCDITTAHLQASIEMLRSLEMLSQDFKRKSD